MLCTGDGIPMKKDRKSHNRLSDLKKKFQAILAHEHTLARSVAATVIRPKPLSVWEVLIPIIFILMFMKSREEREVFVQNLMFTKKKALEAAFEMIRDQRSIEEMMTRIDEHTQELMAATPDGIYSDLIRREQIKEIRFLIDHYSRLLTADGTDFKTLLINTYPTVSGYRRFLKRLGEMEARVTAAARETLGPRTDTQTLARIETAVDRTRLREAEEIYSSG